MTTQFFSFHSSTAHISSLEQYLSMHAASVGKLGETARVEFWRKTALEHLSWFAPFTHVFHGSLEEGNTAWFLNGKLNASFNCLDRHLDKNGGKVALIMERDEPGQHYSVTYNELFSLVCKCANMLKYYGVKRGDSVCIYMPMSVESVVAILACWRIGAPHSVVFAGFSAESLRGRMEDGRCKFLITAEEGRRAGKPIHLKRIVNEAIQGLEISRVFVFPHSEKLIVSCTFEVDAKEAMKNQKGYCPCEWMDSEDTLFYLYTSGSTGKPKGIAHTTAGYLLMAALSTKFVFDLQSNDIFACVADIGWITGHTYIVAGPLSNCATTFLFESTPLYPSPSRYWECVEKHKISIFYTAPTAIRALMKFGDEPVKKHDISSLRLLGSVGEPINPEAFHWYFQKIGRGLCPVLDTYWQTETGSHAIAPLPFAIPQKAGSATLPFFGIDPVLVDATTGKEIEGNAVSGVLCFKQAWPSMCRTIFGDHDRYFQTYLKPYPGYYFTGDGATRDEDGYYFVTGRVDDVMNVSGHRISSAETESALLSPSTVEAAVIGVPHDIKGTAIFAFVIPKQGVLATPELVNELKHLVRKHIGAIAVPDYILITAALPKTRSGKIMRRILRKIATDELDSIGDISTLADPNVVADIIRDFHDMKQASSASRTHNFSVS